jgi:voltage-gated potassium channel
VDEVTSGRADERPAGSDDELPVRLPKPARSPFGSIQRRLVLAIGLVIFVAVVAYVDRGGYKDAAGDEVSLLDAFYYATVSITTTGYGDVAPVTDRARLMTTLLITPARVLFLILLVGTTLEFLAERTRESYRVRRWRADLQDHTIICGYGSKGRSAVKSMLGAGVDPSRIVVIDSSEQSLGDAKAAGLAAVAGDATHIGILHAAGVEKAAAVVVAANRDDAAVLITLTARELNGDANIVAAVREEENAHLLRQGGANSVITSSSAAGRLLGLATQTPNVVEVLEDLLSVGAGLDLIERDVGEEDAGGRLVDFDRNQLAVAVVRDGEVLRFDDERAERLEAGDRIVCLCSQAD